MNRRTANVLLLIAGVIWGMGFIAQQTAMDDMSPILFIGLRFLLAAAVVAPLAVVESRRTAEPLTSAHWRQYSALAAVFFLAMSLQQLGLLDTTVTNAGFLTTLYVIMVPVVLLVLFRRKQPAAVWIASLVSIVGIYLLSNGDFSRIRWGDMLVVLCAVFWAAHVILVERFATGSKRPIAMATTQFAACGGAGLAVHAVGVFLGWVDVGVTAEILWAALPEILYAGAFSGGLAFTLQIVAQQHTSSSVAAILMGTESLFAAIGGAILLGERLNVLGYVGCALIFGSVIAVELLAKQE